MNFDKNLIAKNFSRGSKTYDEAAQVQLAEAKELVEFVVPYLKKDSRILDLGSGTSFIAKEIISSFLPSSSLESAGLRGSQESYSRDPRIAAQFKDDGCWEGEIVEVDISAEMLAAWHDRPSNITAIQADFENLPFAENSFDLIISSFALHWISDFEKNFSRFFSLLKPNGVLAFCLPTQGSLPELVAFNINEFPSNSVIKNALKKSGFHEKFFVEKITQQNFQTRREALKFLKRIGANSPAKTKLPLKRSAYKNAGSALSWHISHFICTKNDR